MSLQYLSISLLTRCTQSLEDELQHTIKVPLMSFWATVSLKSLKVLSYNNAKENLSPLQH